MCRVVKREKTKKIEEGKMLKLNDPKSQHPTSVSASEKG